MHICLFGKPQGVELLAIGPGGPDFTLATSLYDRVALPEPLAPEPGDEIVRVSRYWLDGRIYTWIGLYRHAFAIGSLRIGGFYGAAVLYEAHRGPGAQTLGFLQGVTDDARGAFLDSDTSTAAFLRKPAPELVSLDFKAIEAVLDRQPPTGTGLDPAAPSELFIDLSDTRDRHRFAEFVDLAQTDARFSAYSTLYLSSAPRVGRAAQGAKSTTRVVHFFPDMFLDIPPPVAPAPPAVPVASDPAPAAPAKDPVHFALSPTPPPPPLPSPPPAQPADAGHGIRTLSPDEIRFQIGETLKERLPQELARMLPPLLRENRKRATRRRRLHDAATVVALLLLFLGTVLLALQMLAPKNDATLDPQDAATADGATGMRDTGAQIAAIRTVLADYITAVGQGDGTAAVELWSEGRSPLTVAAATAALEGRYSAYALDGDPIVDVDGDTATARLTVTGVTDGETFSSAVDVVLRLKPDPDTWQISDMTFRDRRANPLRPRQ